MNGPTYKGLLRVNKEDIEHGEGRKTTAFLKRVAKPYRRFPVDRDVFREQDWIPRFRFIYIHEGLESVFGT